jgi:hypothetical protein
MRSLLKAGLLTAVFVLACAGTARASTIQVKVPFAFVVQGHTMPAGEYLLNDEGDGVVLMQGEKGNHSNIFIVTTPAAGRDPAGSQPTLTFKHDERAYRLTGIWESATQGRQVH